MKTIAIMELICGFFLAAFQIRWFAYLIIVLGIVGLGLVIKEIIENVYYLDQAKHGLFFLSNNRLYFKGEKYYVKMENLC